MTLHHDVPLSLTPKGEIESNNYFKPLCGEVYSSNWDEWDRAVKMQDLIYSLEGCYVQKISTLVKKSIK